MALTREKKAVLSGELEAIVRDSASVVFVHMKGLPVSAVDTLRASLRSSGGGFKVVKKTLLKRALASGSISGTIPALDGEIAIAYSSDLITPAREVFAFRKGKEAQVALVGGTFDGAFMDSAEIMSIATIPPTPILRGMFVNVINSPIQRFAIALGAIAEKKAA